MKVVARGFSKLIVSYLAIVFVIMFTPVFLIIKDIAAFEVMMNYLFNNGR